VTGFGKTDHVCTRIETHFIACYNSHTPALSRHSDTTAIDKKVCFYRRLFADPVKPCGTITDFVGPLGALIGWHVVPNCSTRHLLCWWYGGVCCDHLSGPLSTKLGRLCLRASLAHPPSPSTLLTPSHPPTPLFVASVILQALPKTSLKISQSIQQLCKLV